MRRTLQVLVVLIAVGFLAGATLAAGSSARSDAGVVDAGAVDAGRPRPVQYLPATKSAAPFQQAP